MKEKEVSKSKKETVSNVIEIKDLSKKYRDFELKDINLTLPSGCIMGLIGENGAGKSTTIKLILDMIKKDNGSIKLFNKDNNVSSHILMEDIGVVFDEVCLPTNLSAYEMNSIMKNVYKNWDEEKYIEYIERLGVSKYKDLKKLSRGNKVKVGIAIALSHNPKLLILDEPTSGLDPVVRDEIIDIFMEFTSDENHAILISSHIVSDLEKACDYIAFLHEGKLIMYDEKDAIKEKYRVVKCSEEEFKTIDGSAVVGKKIGTYGVEALVKKDAIPDGMMKEHITIEDLFVYMIREKDIDKKAKKEVNEKKRRFIISASVIAALIVIGIIFNFSYKVITKVRINDAFKYGTESTGYIELSEDNWSWKEEIDEEDGSGSAEANLKFNNKKWNEFYKDVMAIKGVKAVGDFEYISWHCDDIKGIKKLSKRQGNHKACNFWTDDKKYNKEIFEYLLMNKEAFGLYDIDIVKGKKISQLNDKNVIYIYLGNKYKDIKVGTKYVHKIGENHITYEVAGILKKNSKVVDTYIAYEGMEINKPVFDLDYSAIVIGETTIDVYKDYYYSVENVKEFDKITKKIKRLADKNGIEVEVGKVSKEIDKRY